MELNLIRLTLTNIKGLNQILPFIVTYGKEKELGKYFALESTCNQDIRNIRDKLNKKNPEEIYIAVVFEIISYENSEYEVISFYTKKSVYYQKYTYIDKKIEYNR